MKEINEIKELLLPFVFSISGLSALLYSLFKTTSTDKLLAEGERAEGIIFELDVKSGWSSGSGINSAYDKVTVRFVTKKQEWITADIKNDFASFYTGQYKTGEKINVRYNPDNPEEFVVETKQSELITRIVGAIVGLVFLLIGAVQLLHKYY